MELELKDLTSSQSIMVPEEGLTFGREGGDANVLLADMGVSKRHARVWNEGGAWFLEDLGSSNGTYVQAERIKQAVELLPGDVFQLSKVKLEVMQVLGGSKAQADNGASQPTYHEMPAADRDARPDENTPSAQPAPRAPARSPAAKASQPPPGKKAGSPRAGDEAPAVKSAPGRKPGQASAKASAESAAGGDDDTAAVDKGVGYLVAAVPKAVAYYLAAIPLLLVNPLGVIRKGIEEQKADPKGRMELIAYAIPPLLISAFLGSIGAGIVLAVHGAFSVMAFIPVGPAIGALIGAVVTGFVWHPVLRWVINFLKGESDERSRTNYFLMFMTAIAVLAVPGFVASLLSLIPFRLVAVVGILLGVVAQGASLFIHYSWFTHFNVVKWFRIVILVVGGLGVLTGLGTGVSVLINGTGTTIATGSAGDPEAAIEAARKQAEELQKQATEAQGLEKGANLLKEAQEKAQAQLKDAQEKTREATAKAHDEVKQASPPPEEKAAPPEKTAERTTEAAQPAPEPATRVSGTGYPAWRAKFESIEKRVTDDPTLLERVPGALPLYKSLQEHIIEAEAKYARLSRKAADARVNQHLKDAELYKTTGKEVDELYGKLSR